MTSNTSETDKTRFFYQLQEYGIQKLVLSADFLIATAVFVAMILDKKYLLQIFLNPDNTSVVAVFAAASTLFSITLATLAIILSFSGSQLMEFLRSRGKLNRILFPFWLGNSAYLIVVVLSMVYLSMDITKWNLLNEYLYPLISAVFIYALICTFYLLGTVIRFGYFLEVFNKARPGE